MNRRGFLKNAAVVGAGLSLPEALVLSSAWSKLRRGWIWPWPRADRLRKSRGRHRCPGRMRRFVSRGDVVVVKPNIGWDRTPEFRGDHQPEVVGTITKLCYEAGAKEGQGL